jgi:hypothetical protein
MRGKPPPRNPSGHDSVLGEMMPAPPGDKLRRGWLLCFQPKAASRESQIAPGRACRLGRGRYRFAPVGGTGTRVPVAHFPFPVLFPVNRPEASRRVVVMVPLPWELSVPVRRPEASRNWVRLPLPEKLLVVALPDVRPLASR